MKKPNLNMKGKKSISEIKKKIEDERFAEELREERKFRVAIFGSSKIDEKDPLYSEVKRLAEMLGKKGIDVVTGGGPGLMKAASQGHESGSKKTGARTIGVGINLPKKQRFNQFLDLKKEYRKFSGRLDEFMVLSNAVVVAPGGVGTLLEFFYTWQLVQVEQICNIPIILLGKQWRGLLRWLKTNPLKKHYFRKEDMDKLFLAKNCNEVMKIVDVAYREYKMGNKDFCLNYNKYKL